MLYSKDIPHLKAGLNHYRFASYERIATSKVN
jgi:hypothetical protein